MVELIRAPTPRQLEWGMGQTSGQGLGARGDSAHTHSLCTRQLEAENSGNGERESEGWRGARLPLAHASLSPEPAPPPTINVNSGKEEPD